MPVIVSAWGRLLRMLSLQLLLTSTAPSRPCPHTLYLSVWVCRCLPMMFVNKKLFTTALLGLLVTLSIIALILSLVRVEDVTLPPTVQVSQRRVPEQHWGDESQWLWGLGLTVLLEPAM